MRTTTCLALLLGTLLAARAQLQSEPPCSPPKAIEHGMADWDGRSGVARYACYQGYHLVGPAQVECRYGRWYSDTPEPGPYCKPIACSNPTVENGRLDTRGGGADVRYRSGEEASVVCDEGFELRSNKGKIICREDGSWQSAEQNNEFPTCKEKPCYFPGEDIPVIPNGTLEINGNRMRGSTPEGGVDGAGDDDNEDGEVSEGSYKPGAVAVYRCRPGFLLVPLSAGKRVCRRGKWEGNMAACIAQEKSVLARTHCPAPMSISNGYYFTDRTSETPLALPKVSGGSESYERGTIARYHCKEGYALSSFHGQEIYRCLSDGQWSPRVPPVCISTDTTNNDPLEQVMCSSPPQIPYTDFERVEGWLTSNGAIHGTVLEYSCRVGFRDSRTPCLPTRRTCHAGKWVGRRPTCVPFDYCERPPIISHGFMKTTPENAYHVLSEVRYECHQGYRMKGSDALRCLATGCWTPNELPECVREDLYDSGWANNDESSLPLIATLISTSVGCAVVAIFTTVCLVIVCRRKGGALPPPAGPAHWSTTVTVTPECRPRSGQGQHQGQQQQVSNEHHRARQQDQQDRMALIAFADGVQQVTLPSYEEALRDGSGGAATTGLVNGATAANGRLPEYDNPLTNGHSGAPMVNGNGVHPSQHQQQHFRFHSNGRVSGRAAAAAAQNGVAHTRRSRHPAGRYAGVTADGVSGGNHPPSITQGTYPAAALQNHRRGRSGGSGGGGHHPHRGGDHDALSDSASHHSIHVWPTATNAPNCGNGVANGRAGHHRRGGSASGSSSTSVGSNVVTSSIGGSTANGNSQSTSLRSSHSSNSSAGEVAGAGIAAADGNSGVAQGVGAQPGGGGDGSQNPSCRALAGSLASFDASSAVNADGVPLLEENELETEGSNSSVSGGDTGSATYSETSSKT